MNKEWIWGKHSLWVIWGNRPEIGIVASVYKDSELGELSYVAVFSVCFSYLFRVRYKYTL